MYGNTDDGGTQECRGRNKSTNGIQTREMTSEFKMPKPMKLKGGKITKMAAVRTNRNTGIGGGSGEERGGHKNMATL